MSEQIVPQVEPQVKLCGDEYCGEDAFRDGPLCFDHFIEVETQEWDAWDADRRAIMEVLA